VQSRVQMRPFFVPVFTALLTSIFIYCRMYCCKVLLPYQGLGFESRSEAIEIVAFILSLVGLSCEVNKANKCLSYYKDQTASIRRFGCLTKLMYAADTLHMCNLFFFVNHQFFKQSVIIFFSSSNVTVGVMEKSVVADWLWTSWFDSRQGNRLRPISGPPSLLSNRLFHGE
jgi:hypothetical protein